MKNLVFILFIFAFTASYSQVVSEEELRNKIKTAKENCVGAHESIVLQTNQGLLTDLWGKTIRMNEANTLKFFSYPQGEKVVAGTDIYMRSGKNWSYIHDQQATADLLMAKGVKVIESAKSLWITARQDILQAESTRDEEKILVELYCPKHEFLEALRTGRTQSIEFTITGIWGSSSKSPKILGVITKVNTEKQVIKCENGHEYDKLIGYKFCPKCGKPLE